MYDRLDWCERLTFVLTVIFAVTLSITIYIGGTAAWIAWGVLWVAIAGTTLVLVNRIGPSMN